MPTYVHLGGKPLDPRIRELVERMSRSGESGVWTPAMDIYETTDAVVIVAELAGVKREDLRVILDGNVVRIYGHRGPACHDQGARFHRLEIESGGFTRSFRISVPFKSEGVEAQAEDGFLYVRLPKDPSEPQTRTITVERG
jgi:HSP20 family protein